MHELSIARNIIEVAKRQIQESLPCTVLSIRLKIGALSCVHRDSLRSCFELMAAGTTLQGSQLRIDEMPVVVFCPTCASLRELPGIQRLACPICGTRTGDIRQGNELEIDTIEVIDHD